MNKSSKPYELTLEIRPEYLHARVRSDATSPEMVVAYLHEIIDKCAKLGRDRLLLERDIPTTLTNSEVHFSDIDFAHTGMEDIKIAVLDAREENTENLLYSILVQNHRGANLKLFQHMTAAEAWLLKD